MKKRMLNCLVAAAVLALALTGCGGGQKSGDAPAASEIGRASCRERV